MVWLRCLEFLAIIVVAGVAIGATTLALAAVTRAWRKSAVLRTSETPKKADNSGLSEQEKTANAAHWDLWRKKIALYASDINLLANPIRRDAIEIIKESSNWGRLGIQYILIGNGGALAALPYLLNSTATEYHLSLTNATWSAAWFAVGLTAAALCCLVAYLDFQVNATMYWSSHRIEILAARQRHFEDNMPVPYDSHLEIHAALQSVAVKTTLAGVAIAIAAWFALAWGAFRIILSMTP